MSPRFHAEHIGSLIRPYTLLNPTSKGLGLSEQARDVDTAVRDVLQKQIDLGITPLTNGEYPRANFFAVFFDKLEGFETKPVAIPDGSRTEIPIIRGASTAGVFKEMPCPVATEKVRWSKFAFEDEWTQIRNAITSITGDDDKRANELLGTVKLTIPSPIVHHIRLKRGTAWTEQSGYTTDEEFFADLTACYRKELQTLYENGCRYVQVDDPDLTYFCDPDFLVALENDGIYPDELLSTYLRAHNDAICNRPEGLMMGVHLCRGNFKAEEELWLAKGSYETIAKRLFTELQYDAFFLEYETDRADGFEPLRFLPKGKTIVLGVVSTKEPGLEDLDVLEDRVRSAARIIAEAQGSEVEEVLREQIAVSPQCGFASAEFKRLVGSEQRMWEKLELVRDLAERIWLEGEQA